MLYIPKQRRPLRPQPSLIRALASYSRSTRSVTSNAFLLHRCRHPAKTPAARWETLEQFVIMIDLRLVNPAIQENRGFTSTLHACFGRFCAYCNAVVQKNLVKAVTTKQPKGRKQKDSKADRGACEEPEETVTPPCDAIANGQATRVSHKNHRIRQLGKLHHIYTLS